MSTEKNLTNLVINKVESQDVYDYMKANNLINADELYLVKGNNEIEIAAITTEQIDAICGAKIYAGSEVSV